MSHDLNQVNNVAINIFEKKTVEWWIHKNLEKKPTACNYQGAITDGSVYTVVYLKTEQTARYFEIPTSTTVFRVPKIPVVGSMFILSDSLILGSYTMPYISYDVIISMKINTQTLSWR